VIHLNETEFHVCSAMDGCWITADDSDSVCCISHSTASVHVIQWTTRTY